MTGTIRESLGTMSRAPLPARLPLLFAAAVLVLAWLKIVYHAWTASRVVDAWTVGDWLINYGGGFVRRGASGELLRLLTLQGDQVVWLLFLLKCIACLLPFAVAGVFLWRQRHALEPALLLVVLAPAGLLFAALDPLAGGRKEILLVALASGLTLRLLLGSRHWVPGPLAILLLAAALALLLLMHEGLVVFMPLLFLLMHRSVDYRPKQAVFLALTVVVTFLVIMLLSAQPDIPRICARITSWSVSMSECLPAATGANDAAALDAGPLAWLRLDGADALRLTLARITPAGVLSSVAALPICLLPLLLAPAALRQRLLAQYLVSAAAVLPLFLVSIDWGRWLHVMYMMAFMLLVTTRASQPAVPHPAADRRQALVPQLLVLVLVLIWPLSWRLQSCCTTGLTSGYAVAVLERLR